MGCGKSSERKAIDPEPANHFHETLRVEEIAVEQDFNFKKPDRFKSDVTNLSIVFAKDQTIAKCNEAPGGLLRFDRPI